MQGTRLEVNLKALEHNFNYLKSQLDPGVLFMAVVKANAYGHGIIEISKKLQELGTDYFAVAYTEEAIELRDTGITKPILVLHPQSHTLVDCIQRCVEPVIYSVDMLDNILAFAKAESQKNYPIHLEFNTGLNRIGIELEEIDQVLELLSNTDAVKVRGVQSHLAASEDHDEREFTESQLDAFEKVTQQLEEKLGYKFLKHTDNTSGILNYKAGHHSMVRSGIGLYGYGNDLEHDKHLMPVGSLKSQVSQLREVKKGASISYNRSHKATTDMKIAVIALGHGDGINRIYGYGNAQVKINGSWAPTLGIICMDMFMVDVTDIDCKVGDEVIIFDEKHTARDLAENAGTISYELLTGIQKRVQREYIIS
ncbi:alanine racemase [Nonlabens ponticola]|uniref:Alanine racemase n=1 Tax=Nonlabens ponticola TaxID=2496866 RepID=A0A3S9MVL8_9FLAO|nr:alanine racemase [Nonlabens ponticola]AZQ43192.1 alanine racemase [Nonlabens ponticola]